MKDFSSYSNHLAIANTYVHHIYVFVILLLLGYLLCVAVTYGMYGWTALG